MTFAGNRKPAPYHHRRKSARGRATEASYQGTGCFAYTDCSVLINNWGAITGYYLDNNNVFHGFLRSPEGKFTQFRSARCGYNRRVTSMGTLPNAINDAGAITGV